MKLRSYQQEGVEQLVKLLKERGSALLADEMGLGKTAQAIAVAKRLEAQYVVVVCPASLRLNWREELKKWGADED